MRSLLLCLTFALCECQLLGAEIDSIEEFTRKIPVEFVEIHDPGYVVLRYKDGRKIDATYEGVEHSVLAEWEEEVEKTGENRQMTLTYTLSRGVEILDNTTKTRFRLSGEVPNHPIDRAVRLIGEKHDSSTYDLVDALRLGTEAWNAELNRIYNAFGGAKNIPLRDAQRAWVKYRDAQIKFLQHDYGKRQGTIWSITCGRHVLEITKRQAVLLQQVRDW